MKTGRFLEDGSVYRILDPEPRRPLHNYLWNKECILCLDQFGFGESKSRVDGQFRTLAFGERLLFVKEKSGQAYAVNRNYDRLPFDDWHCDVGLNEQKIVSEYHDVRYTFLIRLAEEGSAELYEVVVENLAKKEKALTLIPYVRPFINLTVHVSYGHAEEAEGFSGIEYSYDGFQSPFEHTHAFFAADHRTIGYEASVPNFTGVYGEIRHPEALNHSHLSSTPVTFTGEYAGALEIPLTLNPHQKERIRLVLSLAKNHQDCLERAKYYLSDAAFDKVRKASEARKKTYEESFHIRSGDAYDDALLNYWLKRQIDLGKDWGRVYGKGFRDIMQDVSCFLCFDPDTAKERIVLTLGYQFENGNCLRQFDPVFDHPYVDGPCWIPATILAYLNETADLSILEEETPYYQSAVKETVFQHIERGLAFLLEHHGEHGLVLWGGGDWNDSIDNAGMQGKGESVWLSIATVKALHDFEEILRISKKSSTLIDLKEKVEQLRKAIEKHGFDKDHYLYGYNDLGEKVGSDESREGKFFLNPQSWAILAGISTGEEASKLLKKCDERLLVPYGYLQNDHPYSKGDDGIGRLSYFYPGLYENGSVYNHGVAFMMAAQIKAGQPKKAYQTWRLIRPDNPQNPNNGMEPYAIANMYIGPGCPFLAGFAPLCWVTGTAGWIYRNLSEGIFGIVPTYEGLQIRPARILQEEVVIQRTFRKQIYEIHLRHSVDDCLIYDGKHLSLDSTLPVEEEGSHHVVIRTLSDNK